MSSDNSGEKEFYKRKIIELVEKIENPAILNYIYTIVSDVVKEEKKSDERR